MSYARWSHSRWYVFHHIESGKTYDDQLLAIYDAAGPCIMLDPESLDGATNEDLGRILAEAAKREGTKRFIPATDAELDELRGYIAEWLEDIKEDPDLSKCPMCGGPTDNGHTRELPPTPYICSKCSPTIEDGAKPF